MITFRTLNDAATATFRDGTKSIHAHDDRTAPGLYMSVAVLWNDAGYTGLAHIGGYRGDDILARISDHFGPRSGRTYHIIEPHGDAGGHETWRDAWGAYEVNPWAQRAFMRDNLSIWAEHMPRPSATIDGMLAYYASPAHREAGRLTPIKPGRYLRKFFPGVLTETEIQDLALVWANAFAPRELNVTDDAQEIEAVYRGGPNSCMSGGYFDSPVHPSRVYAGPDLAVAYIGEINDADGRAVVWPEKKIWARTYGDDARMQAALIKAGYREGTCDDFNGARVQRIEHGYGTFVMPYLDVCGSFDDDGDYLILNRRGDNDGQSTNGLAGEERCRCEHCGDGFNPEQEGSYVEAADGYVCDHCYGNNYFYCEETDETWALSDRADTRCDTLISVRGAERSSRWFFCEGEEEWVHDRDDDYVIMDDGRLVSMSWADDNAFRCEASEEWVEDTGSNRVEIDGGEYVDADYFHAGYATTRLEKIAQWCIDNGRTPESVELKEIVADLEAQLELDLEAA